MTSFDVVCLFVSLFVCFSQKKQLINTENDSVFGSVTYATHERVRNMFLN